MLVAPYKCVFCLRSDRSFSRREHPIPESLGNDDLILPQGFVCDSCNQYFGLKVEQQVLSLAPFSVERVAQAVKNKGGKYPHVTGDKIALQSTGYWDRFIFESDPPHNHFRVLRDGRLIFNPQWVSPNLLVRFLLKMGLELLIIGGVDPYASCFDQARACARTGSMADRWDFAMGLYPDREALTTAVRVDELGPLETRQIYQYSLGGLHSGDVIFQFMYSQALYGVNLSRPPALEYIMGFNERNSFVLESRWKLFPKRTRIVV